MEWLRSCLQWSRQDPDLASYVSNDAAMFARNTLFCSVSLHTVVPGCNENDTENDTKEKAMNQPRFNLKNKAFTESDIVLVFRYDEGRLVYHVGEKVKPEDWSDTKQRLKKSAGSTRSAQVNRWLDILKAFVEDTYREYRNEGWALPVDHFRSMIKDFAAGRISTPEAPLSLIAFIAKTIEERRASGTYSPNTLKSYTTTLNNLKQFSKGKKRSLAFEDIDLDFHHDWMLFLTAKNLSPNTIHKQIRILKTFMSEAFDRGLTKNQAFKSKRFTANTERSTHVVLTEEERERLLHFDFADDRLQNAVDLFLLGCFSGQRFVDYDQLTKDRVRSVQGVKMISITQIKTGARVQVPVFPETELIFERNGGQPPRMISNQKLNQYIKEACRIAGIDEKVSVDYVRGGVRYTKTAPKYELITSHTARRTFASIEYWRAVSEGRSYRLVMAITGHKKDDTFFRYVQIEAETATIQFTVERGKKAAG
jgi:integrase